MMATQIESSSPMECLYQRVTTNIRPEDGASCTLILETTEEVPALAYPVGQEFTFIIGESESTLGDIIEKELGKLSAGETCNVKVEFNRVQLDQPEISTKELELKLTLKSFKNELPVSKLSKDQKLEIAKRHKARGVELFKERQVEYAFRRFSKSLKFLILLLPTNDSDSDFVSEVNELQVQCYSNMALCQMKFEKFDLAVENCSKALLLDPKNVKCLYRRAEAYHKLGKLDECRASCEEGLKVDPKSMSLQRLLEKVNKESGSGAGAEAGASGRPADNPDISQLLQDPEILKAFKDPDIAKAFNEVSQNPANIAKYQDNPKVQEVIEKIVSKFGMVSGEAPGGGVGSPGATGGSGAGESGGAPPT